MSKIKIYIVLVIIVLFALSEFAFLKIIPNIFDLNKYAPKIFSLIQKNINISADASNLKLETFADFSIEIQADSLQFSAEKNEILNSGATRFRFYLLPLIIGHLNIKTFNSKDLNVLIERGRDGIYNFNKIKLPDNFKNVDIKISNANIDLSEYNISFNDKFYNNYYKLKGDKIFINKFKQNKLLDFKINGNLEVNDCKSYPINLEIKTKLPFDKHLDENSLKVNVSLDKFDLAILQDYIKEYFDKTLKEVSGIVDVKIISQNDKSKNNVNLSVKLNDVKYLRQQKDMSVIFSGEHNLNSTFVASDKTLKIKDLLLTGKNINVSANGEIKDFLNLKNIKSNVSVSIKNSRTDSLYWITPSEVPTEYDMIRKVKNYGFFADVNGDFKIKGKGMAPDVIGKVDITNAYVTKPCPSHVPKADIFLDFKGQYLTVNNRSFTDKEEFVDVNGDIELYGEENVDLHIVSTHKVYLPYVYQVLVPVHDVLGFELGPVPEMKFYKGYGSIDLYAKQNKENPILKGVFECYDTDTSLNGLNAKLVNSSARLDFLDKTYHFYTVDAKENSYPISIDGRGDWSGKFNFDVVAKNFSAKEGVNILSGSELLNEYKQYISFLNDVSGTVNADVNLTGQADVFTIEKIKNNLKYKAKIQAKNVGLLITKPFTEISNMNGDMNIGENYFISNLSGTINNSPFKIDINSDLKKVKLNGQVSDFKSESLIYVTGKDFSGISKKINAPSDINFSYEAPLDNVYLDKINAEMRFKQPTDNRKSAINLYQGRIFMNKGDVSFQNIQIKSLSSSLYLDGKIKNIFEKNPFYDIKTDIKKFEIRDINTVLSALPIQTSDIKTLIRAINHFSGNITGEINYVKNKLNGNLALNNIIIKSPKISQALVIGNTNLRIINNNVELTPFTFNFYKVPIFVKLKVSSITQNPKFYLYSTSKIAPSFVDDFLNNYLSYPVKLKGETNFSATIQGELNSPEIYASLKVPKNSDISYMGANLGDTYDDREIYFNAAFEPNKINLKHLTYKKYIDAQHSRSKPLQILGITGTLDKIGGDYVLLPLFIKTNNPINANFFNMIFKKSIIKNGLVECNLKLTGKAQAPFIIGNLKASNVEMPVYNAKIRDFDLDLSQSAGDLRLRANAYNSETEISLLFKNSVKMPFEIYNLDITSKYADLDNLLDNLSQISYSDFANKKNDDISDVINNFILPVITIKKGALKADNVLIKGLNAQNLNMNFSLDKKMILNVHEFLFDLVKGTVNGNFSYNLKNTNFIVKAQAKNVSAEPVAKALFMLDNQIYGDLNGKIDIKTSGSSDEQKMKNLNGKVSFEIVDGKMPKLGSLEYLLHAANLFENGITGMSLNSILQILMPLRTGDFTKLNGSFKLKDGVAQDIQIFTKGKSLNLFMGGYINLLSSSAKMEVWGKLDTNLKTPLGAIGNASLNSLFGLIPWLNLDEPENAPLVKNLNKIPGIEISNKKIRYFRALINGDISSDNFVEKFEWVKN